jgi:hypothetical protein
MLPQPQYTGTFRLCRLMTPRNFGDLILRLSRASQSTPHARQSEILSMPSGMSLVYY